MNKSLTKTLIAAFGIAAWFCSCEKAIDSPELSQAAADSLITGNTSQPVLLVLDEDAIDNGNKPNNFSETDVNDRLARIGLRQQLEYFRRNAGKTITLYSGEVGDEGFHALKTIPTSWVSAGPTSNGAANYLAAGPGLGSGIGSPDDNREIRLDKIPNVTPLRATGLRMLVGQTVIAVVYDGEVGTNYSPLTANLQGANLGIVAFDVLAVNRRTDGSSGSLPAVRIRIRDAASLRATALYLLANAPAPRSSSEPFDVNPPATVAAAQLQAAN